MVGSYCGDDPIKLPNGVFNLSQTPDPETHRIYAYAFKNTVRYITAEQMKTIHCLDWTLIILAVFIGANLLINVKWPLPSNNIRMIS